MIYPDTFEDKTGFDQIRKLLSNYCSGSSGKEMVNQLIVSTDHSTIVSSVRDTWEMQRLLNEHPFDFDNSNNVIPSLNKIRLPGAHLTIEELFRFKRHLEALKSALVALRKADERIAPSLRYRAVVIVYYEEVWHSVDKVLDKNGIIRDSASPKLKQLRSQLSSLSATVTKRLQSIVKSARIEGIVDSDANVSVRNGRGVIPVNVYNKRKMPGLIHDQSSTGKTVFIEPAEIVELNNDIFELEYEERREIVKILIAVSDLLRPYIDDLMTCAGFMAEVDFIRARALVGNRLGSTMPDISDRPHIKWFGAAHPLLSLAFENLDGRTVVPLNLVLDEESRMLVISGPNAGGKSVCLKTTGLLQYMLQCGMTIPVLEGSEGGVFKELFIDIGDEQSIENDLSTYSSHLLSMKYFLKHAGDRSLILIDEFGAGTDPVMGGALAQSILAELVRKKSFGIITTHYTNLKHFASDTEGVVNGAMAFDNHLMQPLFSLVTGKPGSSFAFEIARKIGLPDNVLQEASEKAGKGNVVYDKYLREIARDRRYWEKKRESVRRKEKKITDVAEKYQENLAAVDKERKKILQEAKREAEQILSGANRIIENTVREIKEAQAEREKTRIARKKVDEFRRDIEKRSEKVSDRRVKDAAGNMRQSAMRVNKKDTKRQYTESLQPQKRCEKEIREGLFVKMIESDATGVVEEITDHLAVVSFGNVIIKVPVDKLIPVSESDHKREQKRTAVQRLKRQDSGRRTDFRPQLDIRGMSGEEAVSRVQELLDHAYMISYPTVRILHGKGHGVLRQVVREYLVESGYVKSFDDAPADQGGTGITIIDLDV